MRAPRTLAFLLALTSAGALHATTVYKCTDAKGAVSFQDRPCGASTRQQTIAMPDPPPPPPPPVAPPPAEPVEPVTELEPPPPLPPTIPPPQFYLCTRYDGTRYISDTGDGGSALVPLGVLGVPGRSLADAYSPQNSIGVSAPGLRQIPSVPARSVPFGGMSTWVDDECHDASPQEACTYLRNALKDVRYKLTKSFSDTTPELKRQEADILERMRGC
ncbi:MAG TPA: DUF4124 domain-containing protein [Rhodanobacteraceae bacterium]|nr:DUF4124 domain-containing protein [Rhodanobacteraceae bacterium]